MKRIQELITDKNIQRILSGCLEQYSVSDLEQALTAYMEKQKEYICRTKTSISRFYIRDIDYIDIEKHTITFHVKQDTFQKYGTLSNELNQLSSHGFIKCNQSCIVPLDKIKSIYGYNVILHNGTKIHMSRIYAPKVISAFSSNNCKL